MDFNEESIQWFLGYNRTNSMKYLELIKDLNSAITFVGISIKLAGFMFRMLIFGL